MRYVMTPCAQSLGFVLCHICFFKVLVGPLGSRGFADERWGGGKEVVVYRRVPRILGRVRVMSCDVLDSTTAVSNYID